MKHHFGAGLIRTALCFPVLADQLKATKGRTKPLHFQHVFTFLNRYEGEQYMLENINKNNYITITSCACDLLSAEIGKWITKGPSKFQKWASPFGQLECECTSVGFDEFDPDENDCEREILVAAWRLDAPFYEGEIWNNAPDIIIEYFESDDPHQYDTFYYNWRVYLKRSVLERDAAKNLKRLVVQALLGANTHPSDKLVLLDQIEWGESK